MELLWLLICTLFGHSIAFDAGASECHICGTRRCPICKKTYWRLNPKVPPDSLTCSPTCYHKQIQELP